MKEAAEINEVHAHYVIPETFRQYRDVLVAVQGIDLDDLANPYKAALSSGLAFIVGAGN